MDTLLCYYKIFSKTISNIIPVWLQNVLFAFFIGTPMDYDKVLARHSRRRVANSNLQARSDELYLSKRT